MPFTATIKDKKGCKSNKDVEIAAEKCIAFFKCCTSARTEVHAASGCERVHCTCRRLASPAAVAVNSVGEGSTHLPRAYPAQRFLPTCE